MIPPLVSPMNKTLSPGITGWTTVKLSLSFTGDLKILYISWLHDFFHSTLLTAKEIILRPSPSWTFQSHLLLCWPNYHFVSSLLSNFLIALSFISLIALPNNSLWMLFSMWICNYNFWSWRVNCTQIIWKYIFLHDLRFTNGGQYPTISIKSVLVNMSCSCPHSSHSVVT